MNILLIVGEGLLLLMMGFLTVNTVAVFGCGPSTLMA